MGPQQIAQQWDTGYLVGMIAMGVFVVAGVAVFIGCGIRALTVSAEKFDDSVAPQFSVTAGIVAVIAFGIMAFIAWPLDGQYHRYQPMGGTVTQVGSRFIASDTQGSGSTQKYVLNFADGQALGCLDTRCANVQVGDNVTLMCERAYQWNAPSPGYDCNWAGDRKANGVVIP